MENKQLWALESLWQKKQKRNPFKIKGFMPSTFSLASFLAHFEDQAIFLEDERFPGGFGKHISL
ncbi:hypothetical protein FKX85_08060 [Echinicola soli]|uniref:Uncharacterized protein n=1 Tax=Echinicola soli TaxID=2591634 RepID=A0A514CGQ0_9BACT|nr:hypothetical protein [Echinicola soli]QDH78992.1 hypothetical protein FKX85_08060 [Echinicola soli]